MQTPVVQDRTGVIADQSFTLHAVT